jgi:hypothetical protein
MVVPGGCRVSWFTSRLSPALLLRALGGGMLSARSSVRCEVSWKTIFVIGVLVATGAYFVGPANLVVLVPPFLR